MAWGAVGQGGEPVAGFLLDIRGMEPDHRINERIFFRECDRPPAALDPGSDGDDPADSGQCGPFQDGVEVAGEIRIIEVGVGVGEHVS